MIQGDISTCYDTIDQKRLFNILRKLFKDQFLIDTLIKIFKSPIKDLEKGGVDCSKGKGLPQGSPLSPVLLNVYLSEFDYFIEGLKKECDRGKPQTNASKE
jgi:CRISPR-associated protein Cas1